MREPIAAVFRRIADSCHRLGSPFYGALCELFAERMEPEHAFTRRIDAWPPERAHSDALPIRAVGGLHALVRRGDALKEHYPPHALDRDALWTGVLGAIEREDAFLTAFLDSPPQTNEVARSGILLGCALRVQERYPEPLAWWEIGASAGVNLGFAEFHYQLGFGPAEARVDIPTVWEGNPPALAPLQLAERAGCDVLPLDPRADRERLLAYVWPDQHARLTRTEGALDVAAQAPWRVARAPASAWLAERLAQPAPGLPVVVHTIVWQYLPKEERAAIEATLLQHRCVRISVEGDGDPASAAIHLVHYPRGEREPLGRADFHGRWARWL